MTLRRGISLEMGWFWQPQASSTKAHNICSTLLTRILTSNSLLLLGDKNLLLTQLIEDKEESGWKLVVAKGYWVSGDPATKRESQNKYSFLLLCIMMIIKLLSSMILGLLSKKSICEIVCPLPDRNLFWSIYIFIKDSYSGAGCLSFN